MRVQWAELTGGDFISLGGGGDIKDPSDEQGPWGKGHASGSRLGKGTEGSNPGR